jgi:preprotein translocase subunit Sec63
MFGGVFERMMKAKQRMPKPISSLAILGLGESATEDDMKKSFRELVFKYRQDRGSDHNRNKFESIMDAKNKCDVYFKLEKSHNDNL